MLQELFPNELEVKARTPLGPISVSVLYVCPGSLRRSARVQAANTASIDADRTTKPKINRTRRTRPGPPPKTEPPAPPPIEIESVLPNELSLVELHQLLGRIFTDSEENKEYYVSDLWFDERLQEFVGTRAPADGSPITDDDKDQPYVLEYFMRELGHGPERFVDRDSSMLLLDHNFREAVETSLDYWYADSKLSPHEVFLLEDEHGEPHFYRRVRDARTHSENYQLLIPDGPSGLVIKNHLLFACHDANCHLRFNKMYKELQRRCFWPGMYADAKAYCESCLSCQISGTTRDRQENQTTILQYPTVREPFQRVSLDILGPIGKDTSGLKYLIVAVDHFTKWVEAEAYHSTPTAEEVNAFMMAHFFHKHGIPEVILADNGSNLTVNQLNARLLQDMGAQCKNVTTYHPAANGQVERFNKVICDFLKHYVSDVDHNGWAKFLDATIFAINTSVCTTTGFTPFFLVHGREAKRVIDKRLPDWTTTRWRQQGWQEYAQFIQESLRICSQVAGENIDKAHSIYNQPGVVHRTARSFDNNALPQHGRRVTKRFIPGDRVLVYVPVVVTSATKLQHKKLTKFWRGPFDVIRSINDVTYLVDLGNRQQAFHINRLKLFHDRPRRFRIT